LQKEKVRVYILARELNIDTKDLLDICKQAGLDVKNQLSSLEPGQRDMIEQLVKKGGGVAVAAPPKAATPPPLPEVSKAVRVLPTARRREPEAAPVAPAEASFPQTPVTPQEKPAPVEAKPAVPAAAKGPEEMAPAVRPAAPPAVPRPVETARPPEVRPPTPSSTRDLGRGRVRDLDRPAGGSVSPRRRDLRPHMHVATPPPTIKQRSLKDVRKQAQEQPVQKPIARLTPDQLTGTRPLRPEDVLRPASPQTEAGVAFVDEEEGEADRKQAAGAKSKAKGIPGREKRQAARNERARIRKSREAEGGVLVSDEEEQPKKKTLVRIKAKQRQVGPVRKEKLILEPPVTVRALSEALGVRSVELCFKLRDHGLANPNVNTTLAKEVAEVLALEYGSELDIKRPPDAEDQLLADLDKPDSAENLAPRAPIVTIMGHVDHGKTTLLDKIRASNVAASETGGITQVIRAWRVEHDGKPITFLDTPGHEAFTKMRARGANVTDIAVIVVAADDGVMPQTEEAINHAQAAGVSLVVAINKIDLPSANVNRTRQQLYGLNVLPDNMGGDTPFVETSAATGKGIDELLEGISVVAELKELKANPNKAGAGTCLEAMLSEGEGVRATLLVQQGTLRRGDVILCGATYGRVRQMYNDLGRPLQEAGPSVPVRITGLDHVPNADDRFVVAGDLAVARAVADKRKVKQHEAAQFKRAPLTLETLGQIKVTELKIILKADFRGSIEAIRKELEKLQHEEVRVRVLEAAIGGITENDVWLALTSPDDTIIVGFNVVPDDRARALAEDKGVEIREYDIIYNLTNDIKAALEGKLKPREEVVHLGRAVVRQTFKISKVGTIAGCYVTQGIIRRNAKVRVIREGIVIYPPADRTTGLDSLKRHKDDVAEVREGFECGMKVSGYDDIKVGDVIEAYRVEQVQRTL
jgi:translation initiation factor IF-2